ncbi:oligopeptidase B, partial [Pseudomonas sp. MWU13-2860]
MKLNSHLSAVALAGVLLALAPAASAVEAPQAERRPQRLEAHGDVRVDDYAWLRDDSRSRPEVLAHLEAENRYAEAQLAAAAPLRRALLAEMRARIGERDSSPPFVDGGWRYRESYASGSQQPRLERQPAAGGRWQLLLDGTELAAGQRYYRLGAWTV